MTRPRTRVRPADTALDTLISWAHECMANTRVSYTDIASSACYDRSWVARSLCGRRLPEWRIIACIAIRCGVSEVEARSLWEAASEAQQRHVVQAAAGYPPAGMTSYLDLRDALRKLIADRVGSQRELIRRDDSGVLTRSTVGAVLRGERSLAHEVLMHAIRACELDDDAVTAWEIAWTRLGEPFRAAVDLRRRAIARSRLQTSRYRVSKNRW